MPELKKRPVQRRKLSDAVFEQLVVMIQEEGLNPSDRLPAERELMESFGVGRPVVREAMQRLAAMGMISIQHGERARVEQVDLRSVLNQIDLPARQLLSSSVQNVAHLHEARVFIEAGLVRLAAERATDADLKRLVAAFEDMRAKLGTDAFVDADMAFHIEIARTPGNPLFVAASRAILQWLFDYGPDMLRAKGAQQSLNEHERILKSVLARDAAGAERAMRDHLQPTKPAARRSRAPAGRVRKKA